MQNKNMVLRVSFISMRAIPFAIWKFGAVPVRAARPGSTPGRVFLPFCRNWHNANLEISELQFYLYGDNLFNKWLEIV